MAENRRYTRTLASEVRRSLRPPDRGLVLGVFAAGLVVLVLGVLCAVGLFTSDGTRDPVIFGVLFLACLQVIGLLKVWYWGRLDRNAVLDEIERRHG